ncbi:MAG: hypothetical protein BKP49_10115 [Treponema sp. CETP13]|nr:MAG: hypothetical protein BKP49_10115 [Treponema sp. CETP13]
MLGHQIYGWDFIGSDIDKKSLQIAQTIIEKNDSLKNNILLRLQKNSKNIFTGIIRVNEYFDFTVCNPPFHVSEAEAIAENHKKNRNLKIKAKKTNLNFGGHVNELWCDGGEISFIKIMIKESVKFSSNCFWFTSLVSKKESLRPIYKELKKVNVAQMHTILMGQGHKISRIVAWTFLNINEQKAWKQNRWNKA